MLYMGLAAVIAVGVLYLLWQLERAKRRTVEIERDSARADVKAIEHAVKLERELRAVADADHRKELEARMTALRDKVRNTPVGGTIDDVFGAKS